MKIPTNKTAILIFANSAEKEALEKPFFKSKEVFYELNKQILRKVKNTGIPYFWISEKEQIGYSFGERYTNAIEFVFKQGFENVIAIGNDSPQLLSKDILIAAEKIKQKKIILGPSKDGGFYLLGIQKKYFNSVLFINFPWQTSQLKNCLTKHFIKNKIEIIYLKHLVDIDTIPDIKNLVAGIKKFNSHLIKLLLQILSVPTKIWIPRSTLNTTTHTITLFNKGSPSCVF